MELVRTKVVGASILFALCSFQGAIAQERVEFQTSGAERTFTAKSTDGTLVVVDHVSQTIFIEASDGSSYEVPLETALSEAQPNATLRNEWRTFLNSASADTTLDTYAEFGSLGLPQPICDPMLVYCEIQSNSNQYALGTELDTISSLTWGDDPNVPDPNKPPKNLDGITVVGDRPSCVSDMSAADAWGHCYSSGSRFGYTDPGDVYLRELKKERYRQFQKENDAACSEVVERGVMIAVGAVAVADFCKATAISIALSAGAATPLVGLSCAVSVIHLAFQQYKFAMADKRCAAAYASGGN